MKHPRQLSFKMPVRGGKRRGAGRKPKGKTALVSHAPRPKFGKAMPSHVTLKVRRDVPSLRASRRFAAIRSCFAAARGQHGLRLVEFAVLGDHLHLVVEADDDKALSRGVQGLCIRVARALNRLLDRSGRVFADHYHSHLLRSPAELVNAIRYVLGNARHHYAEAGADACSSGVSEALELLVLPAGWLLREGWRRARDRVVPSLFRGWDGTAPGCGAASF
jgi:putative transposase